MVAIDFDAIRERAEKSEEYLKEHNITIFDFFRFVFSRALHKSNKEKQIAYAYNPLPETERVRLAHFIEINFKNKTEFAKEAGLDLSTLTLIINNKSCGNALTWKKINDTFERRSIELPVELKIKYEVVDKF